MLLRLSLDLLSKAVHPGQLSMFDVPAYTRKVGGKPVQVAAHKQGYHVAPEAPPAPPPPAAPPAPPPAPPGDPKGPSYKDLRRQLDALMWEEERERDQPGGGDKAAIEAIRERRKPLMDAMRGSDLAETYVVPSENLARLRDKLDDLVRRSAKLGLAPISYTVGEPRIVEMDRHYHDQPSKKVKVVVHDVAVTGGRPQLQGWEFVASLRHEPGVGTLIATVPGTSLADDGLKAFREAKADCHHCKLERKRKDTYILRAIEDNPHGKTGDLKQVGSTCLADFTGGANAQQMANAAELLIAAKEASEAGEAFDGGSGKPKLWPLDQYLGHVALAIRQGGWMSRKAAGDRGMISTADAASMSMFPTQADKDKHRLESGGQPWPSPTDEDKEKVRDAMEWAAAHFDTAGAESDYEHNLATILRSGVVGDRTTGWAASLLNYVSKQRGQIAERERATKTSTHQGTVGKRETFQKLKVERVIDHEGAYGTTHIHKMSDEAGNVFTWFSSSGKLDEGKVYDVTASVKKHDDYQGVKQTVLTRAKAKEIMAKSMFRVSVEWLIKAVHPGQLAMFQVQPYGQKRGGKPVQVAHHQQRYRTAPPDTSAPRASVKPEPLPRVSMRQEREAGAPGFRITNPDGAVEVAKVHAIAPGKWMFIAVDAQNRVLKSFALLGAVPMPSEVLRLAAVNGATGGFLAKTVVQGDDSQGKAEFAEAAHKRIGEALKGSGMTLLDTVMLKRGAYSIDAFTASSSGWHSVESAPDEEAKQARPSPAVASITPGASATVRSSDDVALLMKDMEDLDREQLVALYMKGDHVIAMEVVAQGTVNATIARPAEIVKGVALTEADGVYLVHNHPSGSPKPSREDDVLTEKMRDAMRAAGAILHDHVIIGADGHAAYSKHRPDLIKSRIRISETLAKAFKLQGHREVQGIPIAIENRVGSVRSGTADDGTEWRTKMKHAYGYLERTLGADGEEVDVFIGPDPESPMAYIVHQRAIDGEYDEAKVMLGFASEAKAKAAYFANYDRRDLFDHIQCVSVEALKKQWRFKLATSEPLEMAKARVSGDRAAWLAAALRTDHPPERRALYALMAKSAVAARTIDPSRPWVVTDVTLDLAGTALFGDPWGSIRHKWGLPAASVMERLFVSTPDDPVQAFAKSTTAEALAWAAESLADPAERAAAFAELESVVG